MGGDDAAGQLLAASASPLAEEAIAAVRDDSRFPPTPSDDEAYDDLYGDVNVGFIPLLPFSPSPAPTSPPKTPSPGPGRSPSPSPPPHRAPTPETQAQREPEPQPKPATPRHQPPRPPPPALSVRHHLPPPPPQPQRPPRCTALYISELHWWTTDAEVEAALAAHGAAAALYGLCFYNEKLTGKSRGICRADFLHHAAAASAAAVLHGHAFHGRRCVASLARPPALHRLGDDSDSYSYAETARAAPNPTRGLGNGGRGPTDATAVRGNVGPALGDRPPLAPASRSVVPRPSPGQPFGGVMGSVAGYGGFQSMGHYNGTMLSAVPPQMNPAFLAAGGMAMHGSGSGVWHDQGMSGGLWGAQQGWNFRGYQMPCQPPMQHYQVQQQHGNGDYRKGRGMRQQERPSNRSEERSTGNVRYLERRQAERDGGHQEQERPTDRGEARSVVNVRYLDRRQADRDGSRQERVLEKEREQRHCNERDRHVGDKRKHQEYTECADFDRRGRVRSRSQSMDDSDDDRPRRRR
ncbi:hypothetical protein BS78_06G127200 [Paspalum vaginatum]|nr:hypothetical protein BS78_06G127200 [Paspalum vaginatum]